ncbi:hypothetical protein LCGC14_0792120 [marine sediment metagenome]|uniref:Uncharacterized protein n=1 Tax=marine sediment metagenome TaxID=412755 RepID=A0A0F9QC29_9ZZZZ
MEYQDELKKLQEGGNFWKPKVGQFKVKALTELEESDPFVRKVKDESGKEIEESTPQFKVKILVDGEEKIWTFGKGKTPVSTYGQLVELATKHVNQLKDVEFSVVVKSDGTKNDYTIVN